jgi:hypothetical protein
VSAGTCSTARTSSVTWTKKTPVGLRERRLRSLRGRVPRGPPRRPGVLSTGVSFESERSCAEEEIMDFFSKVFPDENYASTRSVASPPSSQATCPTNIIFTGSGSTASPRPSSCSRPHSASTAAAADGAPDATACSRGFGAWELARTKSLPRRAPGAWGERAPERGRHEGAVRRRHHHLSRLYSDPIEFRPQFSMVTCNTLPAVPDNDGGTWRRIRVIEFGSVRHRAHQAQRVRDGPDLNAKFKRWRRPFIMMLTKRCVADQQKSPLRCSPSRSATVRSKTPDRVHRGAPAAQRRHERRLCGRSSGSTRLGPGDGGKARPEQIGGMITKFRRPARRAVGDASVPVHRHVYVVVHP